MAKSCPLEKYGSILHWLMYLQTQFNDEVFSRVVSVGTLKNHY